MSIPGQNEETTPVASKMEANASGGGAHNEIYGSTNDSPKLASFNDIFNQHQPKEVPKALPKVSISSSSKPLETTTLQLERELKAKLLANISQEYAAHDQTMNPSISQLEAEIRNKLFANITDNRGKTEFNAKFFDEINRLRVENGRAPLEYDPDLEDQAENNNVAQTSNGLGHWANPNTYEVANWIGGPNGTPQQAKNSLAGSSAHMDIILNRSLTRMGAAYNSTYQTVRFE